MNKLILTLTFLLVSSLVLSQKETFPIINRTECTVVVINDFENAPYFDTMMSEYNLVLSNYTPINVLKEKDFTCVKSYRIIWNDGSPIITQHKPKFPNCYEIGWDKISVVYTEYLKESCGLDMTMIYLFPKTR